LGVELDDDTAKKLAMGDIDPISLVAFKNDENEKHLVLKALGKKSNQYHHHDS